MIVTNMTFGEFARLKRKRKFTAMQCANALGYKTEAAYTHKERGIREWSLSDMMNLAELYGIHFSQLIAEWEEKRLRRML